MPLLRRGLGRRTIGDVVEPDVVDDHLGVVPLAPLLDVGVVEPGVVARDGVLPLQDSEGLLLGSGAAWHHHWRHASYQGGGSGRLKKSSRRACLYDFQPTISTRPK